MQRYRVEYYIIPIFNENFINFNKLCCLFISRAKKVLLINCSLSNLVKSVAKFDAHCTTVATAAATRCWPKVPKNALNHFLIVQFENKCEHLI